MTSVSAPRWRNPLTALAAYYRLPEAPAALLPQWSVDAHPLIRATQAAGHGYYRPADIQQWRELTEQRVRARSRRIQLLVLLASLSYVGYFLYYAVNQPHYRPSLLMNVSLVLVYLVASRVHAYFGHVIWWSDHVPTDKHYPELVDALRRSPLLWTDERPDYKVGTTGLVRQLSNKPMATYLTVTYPGNQRHDALTLVLDYRPAITPRQFP